MESTEYDQKVQELEKKVRILSKKLTRSEADRRQLEDASYEREIILKNTIKELEQSQIDLQLRGQELENALFNLTNLQLKLVESEKMSALGIMVGGIAHEINNPVSFIYGNLCHAQFYVENLLELVGLFQSHYQELPTSIETFIKTIDLEFIKTDYQQLFTSMNMGAERIGEIIQSLKKFSRLDEADFKKQVDIRTDIENTLLVLNHRLQSSHLFVHGIKIIKNFHDIPLIDCYPGQLNQAFMNILLNAIEALEDNYLQFTHHIPTNSPLPNYDCSYPEISISTQAINDESVIIEIVDNGVGIPPEIHSKLFDPFFTTKPVGKGTGLGLSVCYQIIVQQHHGSIDCQSTPGKGTKFVIKIPVRQQN